MTIQLEFDFRVPCHDPITPSEAAKALGTGTEKVYQLIREGKFGAFNIASDYSNVAAYRIPLKNFVAYLNGNHLDDLYFRFPADDPLTVPRVAASMHCSDQHIYNMLRDGEFPNAMNIAMRGSQQAEWRIPLRDLVAFVNRRREGAW